MLRSFSNDDSHSVTSEAIQHPSISSSQVALIKSYDDSVINQYSLTAPDPLWHQWREEDETFTDFTTRIQEWCHSLPPHMIHLSDPKDPQYIFPQFVSNLIS